MEPTCYACKPGPGAGPNPRMLCLHHKQVCQLPDGAPLYETLALVAPPDGQLEGSALGWLYNPVFVVDDVGNRQRGWTSFQGGGVAVLEDRFGAADPFQFWMCEREEMVRFLEEIDKLTTLDWDHVLKAGQSTTLGNAAFSAWDMWLWGSAIAARRLALGRWPTSFTELTHLLEHSEVPLPRDTPHAGEFLAALTELARRRREGSGERVNGRGHP